MGRFFPYNLAHGGLKQAENYIGVTAFLKDNLPNVIREPSVAYE